MLAVAIDRSREAIASLALAAIVICVALPGSTADIGFQLSFASVIAIVLGMRRFAAWFARRKRVGMLRGEPSLPRWRLIEAPTGYLAVSFWAMLGTAPLTAYHFNQFAIVGIVANALVVPIMAFGATVSGLVAAALSFVSEPAARPVLLFGASALRPATGWQAGSSIGRWRGSASSRRQFSNSQLLTRSWRFGCSRHSLWRSIRNDRSKRFRTTRPVRADSDGVRDARLL
jgi:ComEC/Rec2-related protein